MGVQKLASLTSPSNVSVRVRENAIHYSRNTSSNGPWYETDHHTTDDKQLLEYRQEPHQQPQTHRWLPSSPSSSMTSSPTTSRWLASPPPSNVSTRRQYMDGTCCAIAMRAYFKSTNNDFPSMSPGNRDDYSSSSSSLTLRSTSTGRTIRRRVRFEVNVMNEIDIDVIPFPSLIDLKDDKQKNEIWWNHDDIVRMYNRTRVIVGAFRQNTDYIDQYADVFALCAHSDVDLSDSHEVDEKRATKLDGPVQRLLQTEARGLEIQTLAIWHRYRAKFVMSILKTQYDLALDRKRSRESRAMLLAATSRTYSRTGRILARILAISDHDNLFDISDD